MNVIISNQQDNILSSLNIEIIKSLHGEYEVDELINSFSNFFFSRMILDVTALKDYEDIINYQKLSIGLPVDKIILLIPAQTILASNQFLSKLISMGYYNFTTNLEGVEYLLEHPNSYKDVAHLHQLDMVQEVPVNQPVMTAGGSSNLMSKVVIGIKNVTEHAGATTLAYLMYKELQASYKNSVCAVEVDKRDFLYFNDNSLISINKNELPGFLLKSQNYNIIIVDLNDTADDICSETLYLVEPSIIKMNKLMKRDRTIFEKIKGKKVVLNRTNLSNSDVRTFESESKNKVFYMVDNFNDRERPKVVVELLQKLGLIN